MVWSQFWPREEPLWFPGYQKKIGTYDKQTWEMTVEQQILRGLPQVEMKNTKPNTDFIDLDLVRGSSFAKPKPKQGFMTVARLATLRCLLLPLYSKWWMQQTSVFGFLLMFALYLSQLINLAIYYRNCCCHGNNDSDYSGAGTGNETGMEKEKTEESIMSMELIIPLLMTWILSLIHSQIAATTSSSSISSSAISSSASCENQKTTSGKLTKSRTFRRKMSLVRSKDSSCCYSAGENGSGAGGNGGCSLRVTSGGLGGGKHHKRINFNLSNLSSGLHNNNSNNSNNNNNSKLERSSGDNKRLLELNKSIKSSERSSVKTKPSPVRKRSQAEDDGFESLNGNGSRTSEEEISTVTLSPSAIATLPPPQSSAPSTTVTTTATSAVAVLSDVASSRDRLCDQWVTRQQQQQQQQGTAPPRQNVSMVTGVNNNNNSSLFAKDDSRISTEEAEESDAETETVKAKVTKRTKSYHHIPVINVTRTSSLRDSTCDTDDDYCYEEQQQQQRHPASSRMMKTNILDHDLDVDCLPNISGISTARAGNSEWINVTTNSEDLSYSSELDEASEINRDDYEHASFYSPPSVKASCTIWKRNEIKKAELSTLEISSAIIGKVESSSQSMDYFCVGLLIATVHAAIPILFRLCNFTLESNTFVDGQYNILDVFETVIVKMPASVATFIEAAFGATPWERTLIITACLQRFILASLLFFLLAVAENTFKQRFLYAKLFSHLTSFRRAQQSDLPHFRLNKVKNIKTWLSVRSYLKQRGPQRSVDVIVSTAFIITLLLLSFLCVELLKETGALNSQYHVEALVWCIGLGILLLRFMTLGNKINKKYRNLSVLITEQINLHLQIEQKPHKKEELALANNVLKLAIDLIKELQSPFKISGLSANSILYNTTKLIILSALSGILSEILGFKLKLHKIKIK